MKSAGGLLAAHGLDSTGLVGSMVNFQSRDLRFKYMIGQKAVLWCLFRLRL